MHYLEMLSLWRNFFGRSDQEFWNMTPAEYFAWVDPVIGENAFMRRSDLRELVKEFPDFPDDKMKGENE